MRMPMVARFLLAALACAFFGCGLIPTDGEHEGKDLANGTGETKNWAFTVALSKQNFTMQQGATDTVIVTVTRTGGFSGVVTLKAFVPGTGITVTFESITNTGAVTTSRMIVQVAGSYPVGTGITATLSPNPVIDTVTQMTVNIVRSNFTGPVSISIAGVPPGATATYLNPANVNSLSISFASGTALAGDYPLVVTASAVGVPNTTTTLTRRLNP